MLSSIIILQHESGKSVSSARPSRNGSSTAIWKSSDEFSDAGPGRHHRRRHHGLLDGLSSGEERLEGCRPAGARAAEWRHDVARGGSRGTAARLPEPDEADPIQHRALFEARGRNGPGHGMEAMWLAVGGTHARTYDPAAPVGGYGQQAGRRLRGTDAAAGGRQISDHAHRR